MNGMSFALVRTGEVEDEKKRWELLAMLGRERARVEEELRRLSSAGEPVEARPRCCRMVKRWAS